MNSLSQRLKAVGVVVLVFAGSAFALLALIQGLAALPFPLPFSQALSAYRPQETVTAIGDLRLVTALTAIFLAAAGAIVAIESAYCDRMLEILADVLLMTMAAIAGSLAGYWAMLRFMSQENFVTGAYVQAALVCPAIVFLLSMVPPQRLRTSPFLRFGAAVLLVLAAPALLLLTPIR